MNKLLILALLASTAASAQDYQAYRQVDGATGPGVTYTKRVLGRVISVGSPITRNFPVSQGCVAPPTAQQVPTSANVGTLIGAVTGAIIGSRVGQGTGRDVALAGGAVVGALVGNDYYQNRQAQQPTTIQCQQQFETRVIGWSYTVQYEGIQVQGMMKRQPQIGEEVEVIATTTFYAGSGSQP